MRRSSRSPRERGQILVIFVAGAGRDHRRRRTCHRWRICLRSATSRTECRRPRRIRRGECSAERRQRDRGGACRGSRQRLRPRSGGVTVNVALTSTTVKVDIKRAARELLRGRGRAADLGRQRHRDSPCRHPEEVHRRGAVHPEPGRLRSGHGTPVQHLHRPGVDSRRLRVRAATSLWARTTLRGRTSGPATYRARTSRTRSMGPPRSTPPSPSTTTSASRTTASTTTCSTRTRRTSRASTPRWLARMSPCRSSARPLRDTRTATMERTTSAASAAGPCSTSSAPPSGRRRRGHDHWLLQDRDHQERFR